jgi:hypothetical protein
LSATQKLTQSGAISSEAFAIALAPKAHQRQGVGNKERDSPSQTRVGPRAAQMCLAESGMKAAPSSMSHGAR